MEMKVNIRQVDHNLHFEATNAHGNKVQVDGDENRQGMRPMELLLSALGTCSAFDAVHILRKQRQELTSMEIEVTGTRPDEGYPKPFTAAHIHFIIGGAVDPQKGQKAVDLAVEKYCSVSATMDQDVKITYSVTFV